MASQTSLVSFVLRFVLDEPPSHSAMRSRPRWHGVIQHVQTNDEMHFARWEEAVAFIEQYVDLTPLPPLPK
jgi:hypothetical protein